jgi:hypothetical protein
MTFQKAGRLGVQGSSERQKNARYNQLLEERHHDRKKKWAG